MNLMHDLFFITGFCLIIMACYFDVMIWNDFSYDTWSYVVSQRKIHKTKNR